MLDGYNRRENNKISMDDLYLINADGYTEELQELLL